MSLPHDWRRAPASTYRLQLHHEFGFEAAERVVPYIARLGATACYSSPILMARAGSTHGYDIVDHNRINPELGGEDGFGRLSAALRAHELRLILDFVPNHMAADAGANPWWRDVLENGSCSRHADVFDIDWFPPKAEIRHKLLLPVLGDHYGNVLERGELSVTYDHGSFTLHYFDRDLPVNPRPATIILRAGLDVLRRQLGDDDPHMRELLSVVTGLDHLPPFMSTSPALIEERDREKEILKHRLAMLVEASPDVRSHIDRAVARVTGTPGDPDSFDLLHELLEAQPYRLAYWRVAGHEINYRRFFDINDLAAIRMERPDVFDATHQLLKRLLEEDLVQGVRVDHPDGLFDPEAYFGQLSSLNGSRLPYVLAEKILSANERLVTEWAIDGTTGYDFLNDVGGVFVDTASARRMRAIHGRVSGQNDRLTDVVYRSKLAIMDSSLSSELNVLADALDRLSESDRHSRDFTLNSLRSLLAETIACFPTYRTYITERGASDSDRQAIDRALVEAQARNPTMEASSFEFLRGVLLPASLPDPRRLAVTMKLQQLTAPVQAKGLEDTAFYRHNVLVSLNEVGGDPARFGRTVAEFHSENSVRATQWPLGMLATSTHDTKLGEDARMRVHALAELPVEWGEAVTRWQRLTASARRRLPNGWAPDGSDVYRFYQTLVACWPPDALGLEAAPDGLVERMQQYAVKATREAKLHTSWVTENHEYESAVGHFIARVLSGPPAARFLRAFDPIARKAMGLGAIYSLAQLALKLASPGVPDFYQGSEFWTLTLVDPDNRRPIDFDARIAALDALEPLLDGLDSTDPIPPRPDVAAAAAALAETWTDGRVKLYVTAAGLRLRRAHPDLFLAGEYVPLEADVPAPAGVVAFARRRGRRTAVVVVPRLIAGIADPVAGPAKPAAWGDARLWLPADLAVAEFVDVFTGVRHAPTREPDGRSSLPLGALLGPFPVALAVGLRV
jgi:(1->4)-alpha-D-glucan 1-alpha-D-glucosylmutase